MEPIAWIGVAFLVAAAATGVAWSILSFGLGDAVGGAIELVAAAFWPVVITLVVVGVLVSPSDTEPTSRTAGDCDANYSGECLDPNASDYDCIGGSGNGPEYTGTVRIIGEDEFGLDRDGNGVGCE